KGARGLWQFMPETARRYGLVVSESRDERMEITKSSRAAARYLRDLYKQFGDWRLALAAYNAGEQLVEQGVARNGQARFFFHGVCATQ
ncbi:MAG TPA: lytic transglycosylase domain-containing protein, partial [Terriglobales bacterium]